GSLSGFPGVGSWCAPSAAGWLLQSERRPPPVIGRAATLTPIGRIANRPAGPSSSALVAWRRAVLGRPESDLRARVEAELVQDVLHVCGHGPLSDHQPLGNLAVAQPLCQQRGHLVLTRRERRCPWRLAAAEIRRSPR